MRELNELEIDMISGGADESNAFYRLGANFAHGYNWAVTKTSDFFEWLSL
ncbi:hypothetical protein [Ensifer sesbaniae]|nr:hypothetical protein [Ensifer sesbaniae]NRQ17608.1 hypothetical protein [Ensifer sesbaniae]